MNDTLFGPLLTGNRVLTTIGILHGFFVFWFNKNCRASGEGVLPQEYTLVKLELARPFPEKLKSLENFKVSSSFHFTFILTQIIRGCSLPLAPFALRPCMDKPTVGMFAYLIFFWPATNKFL